MVSKKQAERPIPKIFGFIQRVSVVKASVWYISAAVLLALVLHLPTILFASVRDSRWEALGSVLLTALVIVLIVVVSVLLRYLMYVLLRSRNFRGYFALHAFSFACFSVIIALFSVLRFFVLDGSLNLVADIFISVVLGENYFLSALIPYLIVVLESVFVVIGMGYFLNDFRKALGAELGGFFLSGLIVRFLAFLIFVLFAGPFIL